MVPAPGKILGLALSWIEAWACNSIQSNVVQPSGRAALTIYLWRHTGIETPMKVCSWSAKPCLRAAKSISVLCGRYCNPHLIGLDTYMWMSLWTSFYSKLKVSVRIAHLHCLWLQKIVVRVGAHTTACRFEACMSANAALTSARPGALPPNTWGSTSSEISESMIHVVSLLLDPDGAHQFYYLVCEHVHVFDEFPHTLTQMYAKVHVLEHACAPFFLRRERLPIQNLPRGLEATRGYSASVLLCLIGVRKIGISSSLLQQHDQQNCGLHRENQQIQKLLRQPSKRVILLRVSW